MCPLTDGLLEKFGGMKRILIFAPINLNVMDGSAIWLRSAIQIFGGLKDSELHYLAANCPFGDIKAIPGAKKTVYPSSFLLTHSGYESLRPGLIIDSSNAADAVAVLDSLYSYDYVIVRGRATAIALSGQFGRKVIPYLTDVDPPVWPNRAETQTRRSLASVFEKAPMVLCQTPELLSVYERILPGVSSKAQLLPPMIPDEWFDMSEGDSAAEAVRVHYAGKFAAEWGTNELIELTGDMAGQGIEFHIYGDKIHKEGPGFAEKVRGWLEGGAVQYQRRVERETLVRSYKAGDLGYGFRTGSVRQTPEVSTKFLEYIARGVAPIVNRNAIHEQYLGEDYPLFADSYEEVKSAIHKATAVSAADRVAWLERASGKLQVHRRSVISASVERAFERLEPVRVPVSLITDRKPQVLISGHDLKFMNELRSKFLDPSNFDIDTDLRPSFRHSDRTHNKPLSDYDAIFCEWAVGNAVYYSHAKLPRQKLYVRFHRFEITTEVPQLIDIDAVDKVIFVSEHLRRDAISQYDWPEDKTAVIPNMVNVESYSLPKYPHSRFNIGMLGFLPKLKRMDLALDLLEALRRRDKRYQLHLKGKMPWELAWVWTNPGQREYFDAVLERIRTSELLRGAVVFDRFAADTAAWFQRIGWILSLSDIESFHLAAMEGMASGAVPMVRERSGARELFPESFIFSTTEEMVDAIMAQQSPPPGVLESHARQFDLSTVGRTWADLFARGLVNE